MVGINKYISVSRESIRKNVNYRVKYFNIGSIQMFLKMQFHTTPWSDDEKECMRGGCALFGQDASLLIWL